MIEITTYPMFNGKTVVGITSRRSDGPPVRMTVIIVAFDDGTELEIAGALNTCECGRDTPAHLTTVLTTPESKWATQL